MANTIQLKRSSTASDTPTASDLAVGELAVNTADAKLFTKHTDNSIKEISGGSGSGGMSELLDDTSPQLGGTLDTNNNTIEMDVGKAIYFGSPTSSYFGLIGYDSNLSQYGSNGAQNLSSFNLPIRVASTFDSNYFGSQFTVSNIIETNNTSSNTPLIVRTQTGSATDNLFSIDYQGAATFEKGVVNLKNTGTQSEIRLYCETTNQHYSAIKAASHADLSGVGNVTLTLPNSTGTLATTTNVSSSVAAGDVDKVDGKHIAVVSSLPSSPDSNTIYFIT